MTASIKTWLPPLALAFAGAAGADAYKCRTVSGEIVISNVACEPGSRIQAVQPSEPVPPERRRQAEQEAERQKRLLAERESERAAAARRQAEERKLAAAEEAERHDRCLREALREADPTQRARMAAACGGSAPREPVVIEQPVLVPLPVYRRRPPPSPPPGPCPGAGCPPPRPPAEPAAALGAPPAGSTGCRPGNGTMKCP